MNPRTDIDLAALRDGLEQRATMLRRESVADQDKLAATRDPQTVLDRKDEADLAIRAAIDSAGYERDLAELAEVEAALARVQEGRYGLCRDCSEPIPSSRLTAQPWASRCIACQTRHEQGPRIGG